ncbi:hypothetical protein [Hymenobacter negativus]|uniref:Uncharacterized protein n=1 Tax=Hymenobacter negativus TaxID=2795026 RepID=A0ABS3QKX3_9BACT|nr:hypothetical protein [Hymenobacter negativus]MBO2011658.1 hypothetical protein [Hymenobacter negativus]
MNQSFRAFVLAGAGLLLAASCQPQTKSGSAASTKPAAAIPEMPTAAPAMDGGRPSVSLAATKATASVADAPAFLVANNLAPLWQANFGQQENNHSRPTILDGFYGPEHRHISVIVEQVRQDAAHPNVFQVQGRTRYKKNITPFDGTITVDAVKPLKVYLDLDSVEEAHAHAYTATAHFVLRENPAADGAGTYRGTAAMDFYQLGSGKLDLVQTLPDNSLPTGGGGLLFRGQWQSLRSGLRKDVAFATYAQAVVPDAMSDLYIGDRGDSLNPKYARLDWSEAWENDEWWAKPAKPALSL